MPLVFAAPNLTPAPSSTSAVVSGTTNWTAVEAWASVAVAVATIVLVLFTYRTANSARQEAKSARADADRAIETAQRNNAALIRDANSRAERDLYREMLIKTAEWLSARKNAPSSNEARGMLAKSQTLVSILPASEFPLPITRTFLQADNRPDPAPDDVAQQASANDNMLYIRREIGAAVIHLHDMHADTPSH